MIQYAILLTMTLGALKQSVVVLINLLIFFYYQKICFQFVLLYIGSMSHNYSFILSVLKNWALKRIRKNINEIMREKKIYK